MAVVTPLWITADANVRAAEGMLGIKSLVERRAEEQEKQRIKAQQESEARERAIAERDAKERARRPQVDIGDLSSVDVGGVCVWRGMQLQDVVRAFDGDRAWQFQWSENLASKSGMIAALLPRLSSETGYLLQFDFASGTIGQARLSRIAWTGRATDSEYGPMVRRVGCR